MKKYQDFINEKWMLKIDESLFDKIESMVKGQSDKGKIIKQLLDKNGIKESGQIYSINWTGGSDPGKKELSNPIDYLHYQPNICKIDSNSNLIILDEKSKTLKVPDVMSFLAITDKKRVEEPTGPGKGPFNLFKSGSIVSKGEYKFNLSIDVPTINITPSTYSIIKQNWIPGEAELINLDDDISEMEEDEILSFKTVINIITLQQFVDNINNHPKKSELIDYLVNTLKFKSEASAPPATTAPAAAPAPATNSAQPEKHAAQPAAQAQPVAAEKPAVKIT